jgi:hypothetical protein
MSMAFEACRGEFLPVLRKPVIKVSNDPFAIVEIRLRLETVHEMYDDGNATNACVTTELCLP